MYYSDILNRDQKVQCKFRRYQICPVYKWERRGLSCTYKTKREDDRWMKQDKTKTLTVWKGGKRKRAGRSQIQLLLMTLPAAVIILLYNYLPMLGLGIAFQNFRVDRKIWENEFVGFKNFEFLFTSQDAFRIIRNTIGLNLLFIVTVLFISVTFALMLNEIKHRGFIKCVQTVMFFPYFLSWVVASYMLYAFLNMDLGIVNNFLGLIGQEKIMWYAQAQYWPFIMVLAFVWKNGGYYTVIYYAGLMGIDSEYYEAASIDGATKWQQIRYISLPLLKPLITVMVLLQIGKILFADFGMFLNLPMQNGALFSTTDVIDTYVFRAFRVTGQVGLASAAGFVQSIVGFLMVFTANWIVRRKDPDNALF